MPKAKRVVEEDDLEDDVFEHLSEEEEEDKPKPKKKAKKQTKKKEGEEEKKPPKKKAPPNPTEPTLQSDGFVVHPKSLIHLHNDKATPSTKVAGIDLDGTLILRKGTASFALDENDWRLFNEHVATKLKELHATGYTIVIFSNQGGIKGAMLGAMSEKVRKIILNVLDEIAKELGGERLPIHVVIATASDIYRKPEKGMWDFFVSELNGYVQPKLEDCFYVGDAAGRAGDINNGADSDKMFAENVGIKFILPEDFFGPPGGPAVGNAANAALAAAFSELADLYKKTGEGFKARAFITVADVIRNYDKEITSSKDLKGTKGVGKSSQNKIDEFLESGTMAVLEELRGGGGGFKVVQSKDAEMAMKFV